MLLEGLSPAGLEEFLTQEFLQPMVEGRSMIRPRSRRFANWPRTRRCDEVRFGI